jgi:hypothetical protein
MEDTDSKSDEEQSTSEAKNMQSITNNDGNLMGKLDEDSSRKRMVQSTVSMSKSRMYSLF